jgi:hypothetical protein
MYHVRLIPLMIIFLLFRSVHSPLSRLVSIHCCHISASFPSDEILKRSNLWYKQFLLALETSTKIEMVPTVLLRSSTSAYSPNMVYPKISVFSMNSTIAERVRPFWKLRIGQIKCTHKQEFRGLTFFTPITN